MEGTYTKFFHDKSTSIYHIYLASRATANVMTEKFGVNFFLIKYIDIKMIHIISIESKCTLLIAITSTLIFKYNLNSDIMFFGNKSKTSYHFKDILLCNIDTII